jgi:hypothetical protein
MQFGTGLEIGGLQGDDFMRDIGMMKMKLRVMKIEVDVILVAKATRIRTSKNATCTQHVNKTR